MKNFVVFGMVAICTVLMASESTMAVVGGGGGGKNTAKAKFIFNNVGGETIAIWVRAPGTPLPGTLGALKNQLIFLEVDSTVKSDLLKKGEYAIAYGFSNNLPDAPDNTPITEDDIVPFVVGDFTESINGVDVEIDLPRNEDI